MPEGMNVEVAHKLSERERVDRRKHRWEEAVEVFAAIATAWTGYQAARGDGAQSVLYGEATRDRFAAAAAATLGGQQLVADSAMFNGWLQARAADDPQLQAVFVRRFTPDYRSAFAAWVED